MLYSFPKKLTIYVARYTNKKGTRYRPTLPTKNIYNALSLHLPKNSNGRYLCRYLAIININHFVFAAGTLSKNILKLTLAFHTNLLNQTTILPKMLIELELLVQMH